MCGRYAAPSPEEFQAFIEEWIGEAQYTQYNFAPSEQAPVILLQDKRWVGRPMRWGLIPFWADSPEAAGRYSLINARVETIHEKRSYKHPFRHRRCLVPADGCYEWRKTDVGKQL